jgi:hypothetical protein
MPTHPEDDRCRHLVHRKVKGGPCWVQTIGWSFAITNRHIYGQERSGPFIIDGRVGKVMCWLRMSTMMEASTT